LEFTACCRDQRIFWLAALANQDPIGQVIEFGNMDGNLKPLTIVGIAGDVPAQGLDFPPSPVIYVDYRQRGFNINSSPKQLEQKHAREQEGAGQYSSHRPGISPGLRSKSPNRSLKASLVPAASKSKRAILPSHTPQQPDLDGQPPNPDPGFREDRHSKEHTCQVAQG
jgi:hypothetical protein